MGKAQGAINTANISTLSGMVLAKAENSGLMAYLRGIADQIKEDGISEATAIHIACEHLADILADEPFRNEIVKRTRSCRGLVAPFRPYNNLF